MEATVESFRLLSDEQLLAEVRILVARERTATAVLVASLAELEARELHLAQGYASLYQYCTNELHLSSKSAYHRIAAARCAARFPVALNLLAEGALTLTNLTLLRPHLTLANHMQLLKDASHKTKRQVEQQIAALSPDAPPLVSLYLRLRRETHDKLQRAQDLLRHVLPSGDVAEVFDRALTVLIADLERTKLANVRRPRRARKVAVGSRHIAAAVKRAVMERDEGRCAFVGTSGRCVETGFLEFHHITPFAAGGGSGTDNIELRCRSHNQYEADLAFAPEKCVVRESPPAYGVRSQGS